MTTQPVPPGGRPNGASNVVVVEDEAIRLTARCLLLEGAGYEVVGARSADEAVLHIDALAFRPHAIVTDYLLAEGLTGVEVARRLSGHAGRVLPVIIVTEDGRPHRHREAERWGWTVLYEPVRPDDLFAAIDGAIDGAAGR